MPARDRAIGIAAGFALGAAAATGASVLADPGDLLINKEVSGVALNDEQSAAFEVLAEKVWGNAPLLAEVCVGRRDNGLVANMRGIAVVKELPEDEAVQVVGKVDTDGKPKLHAKGRR